MIGCVAGANENEIFFDQGVFYPAIAGKGDKQCNADLFYLVERKRTLGGHYDASEQSAVEMTIIAQLPWATL